MDWGGHLLVKHGINKTIFVINMFYLKKAYYCILCCRLSCQQILGLSTWNLLHSWWIFWVLGCLRVPENLLVSLLVSSLHILDIYLKSQKWHAPLDNAIKCIFMHNNLKMAFTVKLWGEKKSKYKMDCSLWCVYGLNSVKPFVFPRSS